MPQFYTLDEAARVLGASPDELKKMAERNEVRAFRDRGTLRFRAPEIEEMARRRGRGSDPDLPLGETQPSAVSPGPQKGAAKPGGAPEVFDFALEPGDSSDQVEIGQELLSGSSSRVGKGSKSGKSRKSPPPKPGSDSDVRLVTDGSDLDFKVASDSDVKMVGDVPPPPAAPPVTPPAKRKTGSSKSRLDSGVQMVPLDSGDSDVKMPDAGPDSGVSLGKPKKAKRASDSDIRLESPTPRRGSKVDPGGSSADSMLTDEIDLDAELRKAAEAEQSRSKKRRSRTQPPQPQLPTTSPFELSEADLDVPAPSAGDSSSDESPLSEDSSDFDLTPAGDSSPEEPSSGEIALDSDDEVSLGELTGSAGKSGINLKDPADSGISLEQGGSDDSLEFELTLDTGSTPKPAAAAAPPPASGSEETDSSSEFELSLEEESQAEAPAAEDSDSEFELSLDAESDLEPGSSPVDDSSPVDGDSSPVDSDSEFELTLDEGGGLALDEESSDESAAEGEADIFETDFEVPSLEEESGSEAVALEDSDTDLESSDFDIALGDEDVDAEDESGSQVVALDEGEGDAEAGEAVLDDSDEVEELFDVDSDEDAAAGARAPAAVAAAAPAEWGVLPALVMLPAVIVMFVVALMSYELVRRDGTSNPNMITKAVSGLFTEESK